MIALKGPPLAGEHERSRTRLTATLEATEAPSLKGTGEKSLVGAPAFMRGKERLSAPERVATLILRFNAGNPWARGKSPPGINPMMSGEPA